MIKNDAGRGQVIAEGKGSKHKQLDVSRWARGILHLEAVELKEQPLRNVVYVYACCGTMKEQDWMVLDNLQYSPGYTGDFALWGF